MWLTNLKLFHSRGGIANLKLPRDAYGIDYIKSPIKTEKLNLLSKYLQDHCTLLLVLINTILNQNLFEAIYITSSYSQLAIVIPHTVVLL